MTSNAKQKKRDRKWDRYYEKVSRSSEYQAPPSPSFFGPQRVIRKSYVSKRALGEQ